MSITLHQPKIGPPLRLALKPHQALKCRADFAMQSHARLKPLQPRAEQKLQTRNALMDAARSLMDSGRGFSSLSLREVARSAGIVPTGFYRHFDDMDALALALVAEVGETFRDTIRQVRHHEFELGGVINASVRIFVDAVTANRSQFLFLAREQYGGSLLVRQAVAALRERITADLVADLSQMPKQQHLPQPAQSIIADLVVKTVFATLPELIDPPASNLPPHASPEAKMIEQLRFIFIGAKHWQGLGQTRD
jgi:AcrR family transcriptional regulator